MSDNIIRVLLKGDSKQLTDALNKAESSLNKLAPKLKSVGRNLTTFVSLPLAGAAAAAIKFASDMEESTNKVDVAFGNSAKIVKDFAKDSLTSFGIAESSALDMAAMFGDMSTSMGVSQFEAANLSTELVGLAGDLASFKNINIEEVTTALAGVFTGETESLKRLGVVMTEANLQQFALSQGIQKNIKDFTQAEKVMLRYQFVMKQTSNAHGDFERTGGGAANQMRQFQETLKEIGASFGEIILPSFTKLITKVNESLKAFRDLDTDTKELIVQFGLFAAAIPPLLWGLGQLAEAFTLLNTKMGLILLAVTAFVTSFQGMGKVLDATSTKAERLRGIIQSILFPAGAAGRIGLEMINRTIDKFSGNTDDAVDNTDKLKQAFGGLTGMQISTPALPFGRNDRVTMPTPVGGDVLSDLDQEVVAAEKMASAVDELLAQDAQLRFALAAQAAGVVHLDNTFAQAAETFTSFGEDLGEATNTITLNLETMAQSIGNALTAVVVNGGNAFQALGQIILGTLGDLLVQMGTAAIAASELAKTFAIPIVGAAAGIAAVALGTLLKGLSSRVQSGGFTAFANGGIVSTPTLGLVGEYAGARQNPEVIAPLDKLKSMIGDRGGNVNVTGEFRLSGQDLVVALERAGNIRNRTT